MSAALLLLAAILAMFLRVPKDEEGDAVEAAPIA